MRLGAEGQDSVHHRQPGNVQGTKESAQRSEEMSGFGSGSPAFESGLGLLARLRGQIQFLWSLTLTHTILEALFKTKYRMRYRVLQGAWVIKGL